MLDLLEKGLRPVDQNDWMTAYEIEGYPDLHLSHHYFRGLSLAQVGHVINMLKDHFAKNPLQDKPISFTKEELFGPDKDIRVLVNDDLPGHLDPELKSKFQQHYPTRYPTYRPHVTTDLPNVQGKIKKFYFQRGDGKTFFSVDAQPTEDKMIMKPNDLGKGGTNMPTVNAKVENIEVKRPMTGVALQQTGVKAPPTASTSPKVPVPPKPSPTTSKMNNDPLQKAAAPVNVAGQSIAKPSQQKPDGPQTIDYSKFRRPTYSNTGAVPPLHNPLQHSKGALQGMENKLGKADKDSPKFERCVMHVKDQNASEGKSNEDRNPWAICHASLGKNEEAGKADETAKLEKLRKLRKCMALKKDMPVYMRD